jgi:hypothetical protein
VASPTLVPENNISDDLQRAADAHAGEVYETSRMVGEIFGPDGLRYFLSMQQRAMDLIRGAHGLTDGPDAA